MAEPAEQIILVGKKDRQLANPLSLHENSIQLCVNCQRSSYPGVVFE